MVKLSVEKHKRPYMVYVFVFALTDDLTVDKYTFQKSRHGTYHTSFITDLDLPTARTFGNMDILVSLTLQAMYLHIIQPNRTN